LLLYSSPYLKTLGFSYSFAYWAKVHGLKRKGRERGRSGGRKGGIVEEGLKEAMPRLQAQKLGCY